MKLVTALVLAQIAFTAYSAETARDYPVRPVRLINPFPPGGSSDPSCRLLADALTRSLGQQFVVDNRGGGNGNIGTAIAAKATPDGYVLVFASGTVQHRDRLAKLFHVLALAEELISVFERFTAHHSIK